jgi:hypothetical protein
MQQPRRAPQPSRANGKAVCDRLAALKGKRSPLESDWRDCFDVTFPVRGNGFSGQVMDPTAARAKNAARLDSTGTDSARTLASAIMSGVTPANSQWFALDVGEETEEERTWLDEAARIIWENIHGANFDAVGFECCLDMTAAGWFVLFADINREAGGGYAFEQWPIAECFITSTRQDGRADTIYREYTLTAQQAVEHFTKLGGSCSDKLREKAANKPFEPVQLVRCIEPRKVYAMGAKLSRNLPFTSCDVEVDGHHVILEQGFHEFPCACPRWTVIPGTPYATGPVFDALPDILELNDLVRMEKAAAELAVAGMWIAEDDGVLNPRTVKVGPRKVIVANSVDSMKELKSGSDFNVSFTMKDKLQAQIRKTLMADQLQPQDGPAMTATEVHVRVGLIRQLLGPVYGRLQSEYLQALIERCFGLAFRAGALGQPPQSLANRSYHVRYLSPLARAQKLEDVVAMDRLEAGLIQKAAVMPEALDVYAWDEADRLRAQYLGVPGKLLLSTDDVAAKREARAQAQQEVADQQRMTEQMAAMGGDENQAKVMGALMG